MEQNKKSLENLDLSDVQNVAKMDMVLSVKMRRDFDSLNVSVAAGILMDKIN